MKLAHQIMFDPDSDSERNESNFLYMIENSPTRILKVMVIIINQTLEMTHGWHRWFANNIVGGQDEAQCITKLMKLRTDIAVMKTRYNKVRIRMNTYWKCVHSSFNDPKVFQLRFISQL